MSQIKKVSRPNRILRYQQHTWSGIEFFAATYLDR